MAINLKNFIAFDLETTGFVAGVDRIVEIGAVRFQGGEPEALFSTLVDPEMPIPKGASHVNGITNEMVEGKPKIQELLKPFAEFCGEYVVVAHNAPFDVHFLTADIQKYTTPAPRGSVLDTLALSRKLFPGLPNYKLGTLVQHLGIKATQFHRAEEDASYCGQLFVKILEKVVCNSDTFKNLVSITGKPELKFPQIKPQPVQLDLFDLL